MSDRSTLIKTIRDGTAALYSFSVLLHNMTEEGRDELTDEERANIDADRVSAWKEFNSEGDKPAEETK